MLRRCLLRYSAAAAAATGAQQIKIVECPRDAIQGLKEFVPTERKIEYMNALLKVGFHTLDCGSFVSAPAVPQMRDTADVLRGLDMGSTKSKLLVVVCNLRGAQEAVKFEQVRYLGYPLSVSQSFQQKNTNRGIDAALSDVTRLHELCGAHGKELVTYISMGFGNPYGEDYSPAIVCELVDKVARLGVKIISLADTVGVSEPPLIAELFATLIPRYPEVEFGAHFHSGAVSSFDKVKTAINAGCNRLDGAIGGMGGCPFAKSTLVGNVSTESIVETLTSMGIAHGLDVAQLHRCQDMKHDVFGVGLKEILLVTVLGDERAFSDLCRRHFEAHDTRGVGFLGRREFGACMKDVMAELGEEPPSEAKIDEKFKSLDLLENERITLDEYMFGARKTLAKRMKRMKEL